MLRISDGNLGYGWSSKGSPHGKPLACSLLGYVPIPIISLIACVSIHQFDCCHHYPALLNVLVCDKIAAVIFVVDSSDQQRVDMDSSVDECGSFNCHSTFARRRRLLP
jgi:hypothetical protein